MLTMNRPPEEDINDLERQQDSMLNPDVLDPTEAAEAQSLNQAQGPSPIPYNPSGIAEQAEPENPEEPAEDSLYSGGAKQSFRNKFLSGKYAPTLLAKAGVALITRNKGKAIISTTGIIGIFLVSSFGATLSLVHGPNMAEEELNGGMEVLADERQGLFAATSRWLAQRNLRVQTRLQSNTIRLSRSLEARGYVFLENGDVQMPPNADGSPGRLLTELADKEAELGRVMQTDVYGGKYRGTRYRNRVVNRLIENLNISRSSVLSRTPIDGEADLTKRQKLIKRIRTAQFGRADGVEIDNFQAAQEDVDEAAGEDGEDAKANVERALDDPDYKPPVNTVTENLRANTPSSRRVFQESVDSLASNTGTIARASAAADVANIVCRIGQASVVGVTAGIIVKRWNLINLAGITLANSGSIISGDVDADLLNEYQQMIATSDGGKDWLQSSGMLWLRGEGVNPAQQQLDALSLERPDVGGVIGFMAGLFALGATAAACDVATNPAGQIAIALTEFAALIAATVATAPAGGSGGAGVAVGGRAVASTLSRQVAKGAGIALAVEIGAGYGEEYVRGHIANLASGQIAQIEDAKGELQGNLVAAGLAAYFEHQGINLGGKPQTAAAYLHFPSARLRWHSLLCRTGSHWLPSI